MTTIDEIVLQHAAVTAQQALANAEAEKLHRMVAQALDAGVRAVDIAAALDITRGRVYQLKNAAERKAEQ